jgi:hypothetical protein
MTTFDKIINDSKILINEKIFFLKNNGYNPESWSELYFIEGELHCKIIGDNAKIQIEGEYSDYIVKFMNENILVVSNWGDFFVFDMKNVVFH